MKALYGTSTALVLSLLAAGVSTAQSSNKGVAVAFPWTFVKGNKTPRTTVATTAGEIAQKAGFAVVSPDLAAKAWARMGLPDPKDGLPSTSQLRKFATELKADRVLYGKVSWHTRSIWVGAGPKTISTATASVYVYDRRANKVTFKHSGTGRSDEKENALKVAGAVLLTPFVTAVSGGPSTPREQRAAQIALARAFQTWAAPSAKRKK